MYTDAGTNTWAEVTGTPWVGMSNSSMDRVIFSQAQTLNPGAMYFTSTNAQNGGSGGVWVSNTPTTGASWFLQNAAVQGTDLACANVALANPVLTSASYNFIASDVNKWVGITAGTNFTPGIYQIQSVNVGAGSATMTASVGSSGAGSSGTWWRSGATNGFTTAGNGGVEAHQMAQYNGRFYISTHDTVNGTSVWWSADLGVTWNQVANTINGFGVGASEEEGYELYGYNGALFCNTLNQSLGGRLWMTENGFDWMPIGTAGMGDPTNNGGFFRMISFNDKLFAAPHGNQVSTANQSAPYTVEQFTAGSLALDKTRALHTISGSVGALYQLPYQSGT
jgi:hypothetical protein